MLGPSVRCLLPPGHYPPAVDCAVSLPPVSSEKRSHAWFLRTTSTSIQQEKSSEAVHDWHSALYNESDLQCAFYPKIPARFALCYFWYPRWSLSRYQVKHRRPRGSDYRHSIRTMHLFCRQKRHDNPISMLELSNRMRNLLKAWSP